MVAPQKLIGAQKAYKVCIFQHVPAAGGGHKAAHQQVQRKKPACGQRPGEQPLCRQHGKHHPCARGQRRRPLGKQEQPDILPYGKRKRGAHQRRHRLHAARKRPQAIARMAVNKVYAV